MFCITIVLLFYCCTFISLFQFSFIIVLFGSFSNKVCYFWWYLLIDYFKNYIFLQTLYTQSISVISNILHSWDSDVIILFCFPYDNLLSCLCVCVCCFLCYEHILHITLGLFHLLNKLNLIAHNLFCKNWGPNQKMFPSTEHLCLSHLLYKGCSQPYGAKWSHLSIMLNLRFSFPSLWSPESFLIPAAAKSLQSRQTLCNPIDGSPPGFPIPGILQARTLEWVAISFSNAGKWKVKVKSPSRVWLFATPWTAAHQSPLSMGFSRQKHWSELPLPSPLIPARIWIFP